jgi:hypothetical protein
MIKNPFGAIQKIREILEVGFENFASWFCEVKTGFMGYFLTCSFHISKHTGLKNRHLKK